MRQCQTSNSFISPQNKNSKSQLSYKRSRRSKNRFLTKTQLFQGTAHISFGFEWEDFDEQVSHLSKGKMKIKRGYLPFHHFFFFGRLVVWEPQVEDPLHQHPGVAVKVQRVLVVDDWVVRVRIQEHRHVAPRGAHLWERCRVRNSQPRFNDRNRR